MADQLRELIQDIVNNPDKVNNFSKEDIVDIYKKLATYGAVPNAKESYANISLTNLREKYMWKLLMTTFVGYLYRTAEEYSEEDVGSSHLDFLKDPEYGLNISEETLEKIRKGEAKKKSLGKTVKAFLDRNFNFNPDRHCVSSYKENLKDPERPKKFDAMRALMETAKDSSKVSVEMSKDPKSTLDFLCDLMLKTYQLTNASRKAVNSLSKAVLDSSLDPETMLGLLLKYEGKLGDIATQLKPFAEPIAANGTLTSYKAEPPIDVFYHLERYFVNHYENLREATQILYGDKPDMEFAIQFYESWDGEDALKKADEHQKKNEQSVISSIYTVKNGGWVFMGPFQENRDRVNFYNKDTEIVKRLFEQMEQDHKTGKMLMEKRVRREKQKNIVEEGPDDPGLKNYRAALSTLESLGAKKVLTEEDKIEMAKATRVKEMAEVPSDAIQVDVFGANKDGQFERTKFYTEAEAPKFMEEQIEARKKELLSNGTPLPGKIVTDRHGNQVPLAELQAKTQEQSSKH